VATLTVCTVTALVILTSGVYDPEAALGAISAGTVTDSMLGAPLSAAAFATVFGPLGELFVAVCLILFAFTSLLGASYYGEQCLTYLTGSRRFVPLYRLLFLGAVVLGGVGSLSAAWLLVDLSNGLMAAPNLVALLLLSRETVPLLRPYRSRLERPGQGYSP
jgi:AGCS family alanine or glycine:cation symporter